MYKPNYISLGIQWDKAKLINYEMLVAEKIFKDYFTITSLLLNFLQAFATFKM